MCKLNAAALDTTVACGYNGIDQHNLGLLPPIAGIDTTLRRQRTDGLSIAPPLRGLILSFAVLRESVYLLPPIAGIDNHGLRLSQTPCGYCPPLRGLIYIIFRSCRHMFLLPPIAGIDTKISKAFLLSFTIAPPLRGLIACRERSAAQQRRPFHTLPSTFHTPPCVPLPTFRSGEAASAIRKRLQIRLADADRNGSIGIPDALLAARVAMGN